MTAILRIWSRFLRDFLGPEKWTLKQDREIIPLNYSKCHVKFINFSINATLVIKSLCIGYSKSRKKFQIFENVSVVFATYSEGRKLKFDRIWERVWGQVFLLSFNSYRRGGKDVEINKIFGRFYLQKVLKILQMD